MENERFVPGEAGEIWYEHWHRYHFAARLARDRRVLDIASGEGYGSALFAASGASQVTGVDVDANVLARARKRYGALSHLEFVEGRCESIPLPDGVVDLAVSFETVEHISAAERLLSELARVLAPGGVVLISSPNKEIYSDRRGYANPHHVREFYLDEFEALLRARWPALAFFGQRVDVYSAIWPLERATRAPQLLDAQSAEADKPAAGVADPMYFIAAAAQTSDRLAECAGVFSLLSDRDHFLMRDYESLVRRLSANEAHTRRIEAAYAASQQQLAALAAEHEGLLARLARADQAAAAPGWRGR